MCQLCKYPGEEGISTRAKGPNCKPGEGEIILKLDRDQGSSNDSVITLDKSNTSASILFGERPKINAYWKDENAQESPLSVKWELTGKTVTGNISDKSLFKNTPVLLFTGGQSPYNSQFLDFQTVHTGKINLKVTSATQDKEGTLEVKININLPNNLGYLYNNFDTEIINYANAFGIPPQYLKAHINKEAKKENGQFIPDSFRYEPLSYDIGTKGSTTGGFLKGIWSWTRSDWAKHYADYDSFHYPNGSLLTYEIINKINNFYKITEITPNTSNPDMPTYHCSKYWDLPTETPAITDIYNGNNGWADGSYPNILYNSNGPCSGERQNWDIKTFGSNYYMAYHNVKYYCTPENIPEICGPVRCGFIEWFYNHPFTVPQVPIASTYGLMQIWYITAVEKFKWNRGMDSSMREPSRLLDLHVNLNLGSTIDADYFGQKGIESSIDFDSFNNSIKEGLKLYNEDSAYPNNVLSTINLFKPKN